MRRAASAAVLLLLFAVCAAVPARAERVVLSYDINVGGLNVAKTELTVELTDRTYAVQSAFGTVGLAEMVLAFTSHARTEGRWTGGEGRPHRHIAENLWRGEERRVEITYREPGQPPRTEVVPPVTEEDREPVPSDKRVGTVDPMSGVLTLMKGIAGGGEPAPVTVFDGRRLYRLTVKGLVPGGVTSTAYTGDGWRGRLVYERLGGRSKDSFFRSDDAAAEAELQLAPGEVFGLPLPVPVRVAVDTLEFGGMVVVLSGARRDTGVRTAGPAGDDGDSCTAPC